MTSAIRVTGPLVVALMLIGLVLWCDRPGSPSTSDASEFSEARALHTVDLLTERGPRNLGSAAHAAAAALLEDRLSEIRGVEVAIQETVHVEDTLHQGVVTAVPVRNVLARLPGTSREAILVSAHYDSVPWTAGAADNAAGVAAALEALRVWSGGPTLTRSVIVAFVDAEEIGSFGAAALAEHPWMEDVEAFVNLDAAGAAGKAVLFQAGASWISEAYANAVGEPYGTIFAQDVFQSGVIPSGTDFEIYREKTGLPGLDIALFQDGYAYHTDRDDVDRLEAGSLLHMGSVLVAAVREMAQVELREAPQADVVFFDVLGLAMLSYGRRTAVILGVISIVLALAAVLLAMRSSDGREGLSRRQLAEALGAQALAALAGLSFALLGAGFLVALGRTHGWYARPSLAVLSFSACALTGMLLVHGIFRTRSERRSDSARRWNVALWAAALLSWATISGAALYFEIGSGYLASTWTFFGAVGLVIACVRPGWSLAAWMFAFVPGALLLLQVATMLLEMFIPLAGRLLPELPMDPLIAVLVGVPTAAIAMMLVVPWRGTPFRRAWAVPALVGMVGLISTALSSPYTVERPKRLELEHTCAAKRCEVVVRSKDHPPLARAAGDLEWERNAVNDGAASMPTAVPSHVARPTITIDSAQASVQLRVRGGAYREVFLTFAPGVVTGGSIDGQPIPAPDPDKPAKLRLMANESRDWTLTLALSQSLEPRARVEIKERYDVHTESLQFVRSVLPPWTTVSSVLSFRDEYPL